MVLSPFLGFETEKPSFGRGLFVGEVFLPASKLAWAARDLRGGFFQVVDLAGDISLRER
jgi:hypothetical protein